MTAWTDHVKMYCAKKGISYKEGLKDKDCKESYHNVKTGNKIFNQKHDYLLGPFCNRDDLLGPFSFNSCCAFSLISFLLCFVFSFFSFFCSSISSSSESLNASTPRRFRRTP